MKGKFNHFHFAILIALVIGLKSYIVSRFEFDLSLENGIEEFILLLNSFGITLLFVGIVLYASKATRVRRNLLILNFVMTFVVYANTVYYRFFNDFITIPVLFQFKNFSDLGGSAAGLMHGLDLLLFIDMIPLIYLAFKLKQTSDIEIKKKSKSSLVLFAICILIVNLGLAETQRPQLLTRIFDRKMVVKYLGIYNYHMLDLFVHSKASAQRTFAEGSDVVEVENFLSGRHDVKNEFTGIAKDKNVILISLESFQNFLIDYKVNGEEVTPFLNDLTRKSFYFDNFYHQTGQGKTSDAEFLIDTSLYPLSRGAVFTTNSGNEYRGLPEILTEHGYSTYAFHGNNKSFWNRDIMYKALGYQQFFDETYYNVTEENAINYGLKDIPFFKQSIPLMKQLEQPFHAKFLTLTNHYPYILDEEDEMIGRLSTGDGSVDRYVQTARYLDESIKIFFEELKKAGLYDNSIIILYGDHYGISENHNRAMAQVIGKEITPFEHIQLQKVPFIVHIPGMEGKTIHTVSGQIDVKPTILNLLGIKDEKDIQFGTDLFDPTRKDIVILRDGSFVTEKFVYTDETCYGKLTGLEIAAENCADLQENVTTELLLSDKVVQSDLLRFVDFK